MRSEASASVKGEVYAGTDHDVEVELPDELDLLGIGLLGETRVIGIGVDCLFVRNGSGLEVIGIGLLLVNGQTMRVIDQVVGVSNLSWVHCEKSLISR